MNVYDVRPGDFGWFWTKRGSGIVETFGVRLTQEQATSLASEKAQADRPAQVVVFDEAGKVVGKPLYFSRNVAN